MFRIIYLTFTVVVAILGLYTAPAAMADKSSSQPPTVAAPPVYRPPPVGIPSRRTSAGTRGQDVLQLAVLAPLDHVGFTHTAQPTLYWFISRLTSLPIEFTLIPADAIEPMLEQKLQPPVKPGVQNLRLTDFGVHLEPRVRYRWFISIINDPAHRSNDLIASGEIMSIIPEPAVQQAIDAAPAAQRPAVYAASGLWYDAIDALSERIAAQVNDRLLRAQRAMLLEQVALPAAADYERSP